MTCYYCQNKKTKQNGVHSVWHTQNVFPYTCQHEYRECRYTLTTCISYKSVQWLIRPAWIHEWNVIQYYDPYVMHFVIINCFMFYIAIKWFCDFEIFFWKSTFCCRFYVLRLQKRVFFTMNIIAAYTYINTKHSCSNRHCLTIAVSQELCIWLDVWCNWKESG